MKKQAISTTQGHVWKTSGRDAAVGAIHRFAYAVLLGMVTWFLYTARFDTLPFGADVQIMLTKIVGLPVAIVSQLLPQGAWHAIDPFAEYPFAHNEPHERLLLLHLRLAVPVYVALFYVPNVVGALYRRFSRPEV